MVLAAPAKTKRVVKERRTKIKPSEAYRLGRMVSPYARSHIFIGDKSCAIGAIAIGAGLRPDGDELDYSWMVGGEARKRVYGMVGDDFEDYQMPDDEPTHGDIRSGCRHKMQFTSVITLVEHYSEHHRKTLGTDENIVKVLESYGM